MTFIQLVAYLDRVADEAYNGFQEHIDNNSIKALKYKAIHDKAWNIRMRMAKDIRAGLL